MANEVRTKFTIDDKEALAKIENFKKKLQSTASLDLGKPSASGSSLTSKEIAEQKNLADLKTKEIRQENELQKLKTETLRTEREQLRVEKERLSLQSRTQSATLPKASTSGRLLDNVLTKAQSNQDSDDALDRANRSRIAKRKDAEIEAERKVQAQLAADIARFQKQREQGEQKLTDLLAKQSEQRARNEIRALQSEYREAERLLKEQQRLNQPSRSGSGFLTASFNPVSAVQATAIGTTAYAGLSIAQAAIDRAIEQSKANRLLSAAATEAGLAQDKLTEANKRFAASVGLSNTAAAQTTANIQRLASYAGQPGQSDKLLKAFADLSAARGIDSQQLGDLINSILAGQDEGLNKLGISDPGILYKNYAKSINTTVDALTQQQKVQAAVNAVLEKAGIFAGAAESRMKSLEGTVTSGAAAWENFKDALSATFSASGPVTDFLNEASRALKGLQIDLENVNRELAKGKTPEQVAKEQYPGPSIGDRLTTFASAIPAAGLFGFDVLNEGYEDASRKFLASINPYERRFREFVEQIRQQKQTVENQKKAAQDNQKPLFQSLLDELTVKDEAIRKQNLETLKASQAKELDVLQAGYATKEALLNNYLTRSQAGEIESIRKTSQLRNELLRDQIAAERRNYSALIANTTDPGDKAKLQQELNASISEKQQQIDANTITAQTQIIEKTREYKRELKDIVVSIEAARNPFISIWSDGARQIERVLDLTKGLPKNLRDIAAEAVRTDTTLKNFGQRLDDSLSAFKLRQEAAAFRRGSLDTPEIQNIKELLATPNLSPVNQQFLNQQLKQLETQQFQDTIQEQIDIINRTSDGITKTYKGIAGITSGGNTPFPISDAEKQKLQNFLSTLSQNPETAFKTFGLGLDDIARLRNDPTARLLYGDFTQTNSLGNAKLSDLEQEKRDNALINLFRGVNPADLTDSERNQAAAAFEREADRTANRSSNLDKFVESMQAFADDKAGFLVKIAEGSHILTIKNQAPDNTVTQLGPGATEQRYK